MSRVRTFFVREARECLAAMRSALEPGTPDLEALHRAARRFRGSAHMARFGALSRTAGSLERRLRASLETGSGTGSGSAGGVSEGIMEDEIERVVRSLEEAVEAVQDGRLDADPREELEMDEQEMHGRAADVGPGEQGSDLAIVSLDTLEYRGEAAARRALDLRSPLEDAIVADEPAGPILDELFDLIRLSTA